MKNIHVLQTSKPSRLHKTGDTIRLYPNNRIHISQGLCKNKNIYITSDEEIKNGYYLDLTHNIVMKSVFYSSSDKNCKKIILTTDQDLIKDDVQEITDEFLEWFVKNPSEFVKVERGYLGIAGFVKTNELISKDKIYYKIIIPKEEINN